jgi:hypothetical protein
LQQSEDAKNEELEQMVAELNQKIKDQNEITQ